jgi:hypothetical protein
MCLCRNDLFWSDPNGTYLLDARRNDADIADLVREVRGKVSTGMTK